MKFRSPGLRRGDLGGVCEDVFLSGFFRALRLQVSPVLLLPDGNALRLFQVLICYTSIDFKF